MIGLSLRSSYGGMDMRLLWPPWALWGLVSVVGVGAGYAMATGGMVAAGIVIVGLAGLYFVVSVIQKLEWAAYAVIFTSPLIVYREDFFGVNITLQRIFLGIGVILLVFNLVMRRRIVLRMPPALTILAIFILMKAFDLFRTEKLELAVRHIGILAVGWVIMAFLIATLDSESKIRVAGLAFLLGSIYPVGVGVYQVLAALTGGIPELPFATYLDPREPDDPRMLSLRFFTTGDWGEFIRVSGTLGPPLFGEYLGMILLILLSLLVARTARGWRFPVAIVYAVTLNALLVATFSRSAWIMFLTGVVVLVAIQARQGKMGGVLATGAAVGAITLIVVNSLIPSEVIEGTFLSLFDLNEHGVSLAGHIQLRTLAVALFMDYPIFGVGIGNYGALTGQGGLLSSAHATFFTEAAEGGILGVSLLAGVFASILLPLWGRLKRMNDDWALRAYGVGLFSGIAAHFFNNIGLYNTLYFDHSWTLLGIGLAMTVSHSRLAGEGEGPRVRNAYGGHFTATRRRPSPC